MELPDLIKIAFPRRPVDASKYSVGTVTVVGGSGHYLHAPVIAGLGARASGAGLVQLVVPGASRIAAGILVPEATFARLTPTCAPPRADVTVVGMGLGVSASTEALVWRLLAGAEGRFVLDADALTVFASRIVKDGKYILAPGQELVLTPHEGEAGRLLGQPREWVSGHRLEAIREIVRRTGATVVLKGARTLVLSSDGKRLYENSTGNPFMALGGMGDLLAGVIGARWAYLKGDPFPAAVASVWLHALASDRLVAVPEDPSVVNTARMIGSLRVALESGREV